MQVKDWTYNILTKMIKNVTGKNIGFFIVGFALLFFVGLKSGFMASLTLVMFGTLFFMNGRWMAALTNASFNLDALKKGDFVLALAAGAMGIVGFIAVGEKLTAIAFLGPAVIVAVLSIRDRFLRQK